ncbi:MAG: cytochrome c oxidase subunit 3 [Aggregatilineales bacterium]
MTTNSAAIPGAPTVESERATLPPREISRSSLLTHLLGAKAPGWWGMVFLILNESVLFASLIASNFYLRFNAPIWPPQGMDRPELLLPGIGTVLLVSSSIFMALAEAGIRKGNQARLRMGLAISFLLSAAFIGVQLLEYSHTPFTPQQNVYGALFFGITGLHGLHVLIGVIANGAVQVRAWSGFFSVDRHLAVQNVALYNHFVDAVWIVVFISLYLSVYV